MLGVTREGQGMAQPGEHRTMKSPIEQLALDMAIDAAFRDILAGTETVTEAQINAYANAMISSDKLARNAGRAGNDLTTFGVPLKPGK